MNVGRCLLETVRHYIPQFNDWLNELPDTRDQEAIIYPRGFLAWWGIGLFLFQVGSRRQLDFDLDAQGTKVLDNFNRLAGTEQDTRPVHGTLDHFLEHTKPSALAQLRTRMLRRLIRMKVLDSARLLRRFVVVVDGTDVCSCTDRQHCERCLVQRHENYTVYSHKETVAGVTTTFTWITDLPVDRDNVAVIATQGGRHRWHIENQGFNRQKTGGFELEHIFSYDPEKLKAYYYFLQIAHILALLLEHRRWLRNLLEDIDQDLMKLFGSLKNIFRRLLESIRHVYLGPDPLAAAAGPTDEDSS